MGTQDEVQVADDSGLTESTRSSDGANEVGRTSYGRNHGNEVANLQNAEVNGLRNVG